MEGGKGERFKVILSELPEEFSFSPEIWVVSTLALQQQPVMSTKRKMRTLISILPKLSIEVNQYKAQRIAKENIRTQIAI